MMKKIFLQKMLQNMYLLNNNKEFFQRPETASGSRPGLNLRSNCPCPAKTLPFTAITSPSKVTTF